MRIRRIQNIWSKGARIYLAQSGMHEFEGLGETPTLAILDMRHEYRAFTDSSEMGKCKQGRFHR